MEFGPSPLPRGNAAHRETHLGSFRLFFFYNKRKRCSLALAASFSVHVRMRLDRPWTTPKAPFFRLPLRRQRDLVPRPPPLLRSAAPQPLRGLRAVKERFWVGKNAFLLLGAQDRGGAGRGRGIPAGGSRVGSSGTPVPSRRCAPFPLPEAGRCARTRRLRSLPRPRSHGAFLPGSQQGLSPVRGPNPPPALVTPGGTLQLGKYIDRDR